MSGFGTDTAVEAAAREILRLILSGAFRAGERLPAEGLAERIGTSRTPVREALRQLASAGMVEFVPRWGARLPAPTPEEVRQTYEVRAQLEALAARRIAGRLSPVDRARLEECLRREAEDLTASDPLRIHEGSLVFHRLLAEISGNPILARTLEEFLRRTCLYGLLAPLPEEENRKSAAEHRHILEALVAGDGARAEAAVREHLGIQADWDAERVVPAEGGPGRA